MRFYCTTRNTTEIQIRAELDSTPGQEMQVWVEAGLVSLVLDKEAAAALRDELSRLLEMLP